MEDYTPPAAMMLTQCIYATVALWAKAVFTGGMSPMIFVVYRQAVATVVLVPIVIVVNRKKMKQILNPGIAGFSLVFVASLVGATLNLCLYYQGVHLGSSSMATAMANLIPAITFVMAASVGLETVDIRKPRSLAKIFGTIVCVGGAMIMAFVRGPKLLSDMNILLHSSAGSRWVLGALLLVGSSSCWALWLILQVPICKSYMDPLTLSAWMCLLSTLQTAILVSFLLPDQSTWKIPSLFELSCCIFAGAVGSGVTLYLQSWCISVLSTPPCSAHSAAWSQPCSQRSFSVKSCTSEAGDIKTAMAPEHMEDPEAMVDDRVGIVEPLLGKRATKSADEER
ncbi:hypothetical protein PR202_gb22575 [Eleusine coracana subsp. coracana]|uniref:WAT1-related protein n=1 Tax=Eleusine coracana subsp. coracana TaxID=191504 RepID=A0AAV5FE04_ELECO|nr:hypothetical protein PR202_gb22575 [Eleusine coracana subsp. coracana]